MQTIVSADGTSLAYDSYGAGPALILVPGALTARGAAQITALAALLSPAYTVIDYDRRGRGHSEDSAHWSLEREIEDLAALIDACGGRAHLCGFSSGGALALAAAHHLGAAVDSVTVYEVPFIVDAARAPLPEGFADHLAALAREGRRGAAVAGFLTAGVGVPRPVVAAMRLTPMWRGLKALAPTVAYDVRCLEGNASGRPLDPARWSRATCPAQVLVGGASGEWVQTAGRALAQALPHGRFGVLAGQTHAVTPDALAPAVLSFLDDVG